MSNKSKGWIKTHRSLLHSDIFQNDKLLKIFIWCTLKASHSEHDQIVGRQNVKLSPGQFIFGRSKAALELGYSQSTVWDYMNLLKSKGTISVKSNNKFSIVTIENWEIYQGVSEIFDNKSYSEKTANQQQKDTNKNVKNVKNKKIYVETSNEYRLAYFFFELIRENNQKFKEPNLQTWSKHIDYMIRLDERSIEEIEQVMKWSQCHSFWSSNVLSTDKLRKQFDQLYMQMKSKEPSTTEQPKGKILDMKIGGE